jgi:hypothetical protein
MQKQTEPQQWEHINVAAMHRAIFKKGDAAPAAAGTATATAGAAAVAVPVPAAALEAAEEEEAEGAPAPLRPSPVARVAASGAQRRPLPDDDEEEEDAQAGRVHWLAREAPVLRPDDNDGRPTPMTTILGVAPTLANADGSWQPPANLYAPAPRACSKEAHVLPSL